MAHDPERLSTEFLLYLITGTPPGGNPQEDPDATR
jgi:hypothetical protein